MNISIPEWIKDHPAPAFGTYLGTEVPGALLVLATGDVVVESGRDPSSQTMSELNGVDLRFAIPSRVAGSALYALLSGPGLAVLNDMHHARKEENDIALNDATARFEEMLSSLEQGADEREMEFYAAHELPVLLFEADTLQNRWDGNEDIDLAVDQIYEQLMADKSIYVFGLTKPAIKAALMAEIEAV